MIIHGATSIELRCSTKLCSSFISFDRMDHTPTDEDEIALLRFASGRGWLGEACPNCCKETAKTPDGQTPRAT